MTFTGKIVRLITNHENPYGFIVPNTPIPNHNRNQIGFYWNRVINNSFTRMSLGDLVEFNTKQLNNFIVAVDVQLITNTNGNPNNQTVTKLLKDEISSSFNKIAAISNPYEFEDLVFILLRLIALVWTNGQV